MKLHLPLTLLTAVLATCIALPAQAVEAPEGYTTIYLNSPGALEPYSTLTEEEYIAFILRRSQEFSPTNADYWTSSTPFISGGNVFFGSNSSNSPVALSFKDSKGTVFSGQKVLTFDTLSNLTFSAIEGSAISLADGATLTIANVDDGQSETVDVLFKDFNNGAIIASDAAVTISNNGDVSFSGNYVSDYGGAIYANSDDVTISNNGDVSFSGNYVSRNGGAIYASFADVTISNNGDVSFSGNYAYDGGIHAYGGAIYAYYGDVTISYNDAVSFSGNYANLSGAIYASFADVTISNNGDVSFSGNYASRDGLSAYGGAIHANEGDVTINVTISNNGDVSFSENYASTNGKGNAVYGGAIYAYYAAVTISNNDAVSFSGNYVSGTSSACGGAIYANSDDVTISYNGDVSFSGNYTSGNYTYGTGGGAIFAGGDLYIQGNDSVLFEKNYERSANSYRLRSIVSSGATRLSAKTGGNITFYDSVYLSGTTYFNSDYTDADGNTQSAKGDIIFSGKYAEQHLNEILAANNEGRTATAEEIQNSQTSYIGSTIYLENGTLQVVDGASLNGGGLQVMSSAKLLLRDGAMNHSGFTFNTGSELEIQGINNITANSLTLNSGTTLTANLTDTNQQQAALSLSGKLYTTGTLTLNLNVESEHATGMYQIIALTDSMQYDVSGWTAENISFHGSGAAEGAGFGDLLWQDGVLYYVASPLWSNASGNGVWSCEDTNWNSGSAFREGQDVLFSDIGAGTVRLSGDIAPDSIKVNNSSDYLFTAAEGGGRLVGSTGITKLGSGKLTLATANAHTGNTELLGGTLSIQHSTALGATAEGLAALISAEGTTVTIENGSQVVLAAEGNDIAGAVEIAEGASLEMKGGNYAASSNVVNGTLRFDGLKATAGTLTGSGSVQVEDSSVSFSNSYAFTGDLSVNGSGAELTLTKGGYRGNGTVEVQGGKLTLENRGSITINEGGQLAASDEATIKATNVNILEGATLSIGDVSAVMELSSDTFDSDMAVYTTTAEGYNPALAVHTTVGAVLETNSLNLFGGSALVANGAHIDLSGAYLTLDTTEDAKINLVLTLGANYTPDSQVVLFSNVGGIDLFYDGFYADADEGIVYTLNAGDYFTGEWINENTTLTYDTTANVVYLQGVNNVPEPTTATLSLLALAALAMRRRRK